MQQQTPPFDLAGNVVGITPSVEIDPALSALVGRPITIAGVPKGAASRSLTLGDFAAARYGNTQRSEEAWAYHMP